MSSDPISETEMREALGLSNPTTTVKRGSRPQARPPTRYILVTLSARPRDGGKAFRLEYRSRSISRLEAQLEALKYARQEGLMVQALLHIKQVDE